MGTWGGSEKIASLLTRADSLGGANLLVVSAHPDDEVIGAGAQLPRWRGALFIQVTDGAPRNMDDANAAGLTSRTAYAQARRKELEAALSLAGIDPSHLYGLGMADQEACLHLAALARSLAESFSRLRPDIVITHPYEGGHPDHDATAFAVHTACECLRLRGARSPVIVEMTSYHNRSGRMVSGEFLPNDTEPALRFDLDEAQRDFKRALFGCFGTQRKVLAGFSLRAEQFRLAPGYDFTRPPHPGVLYYEMFDWGATGSKWRALAQHAMAQLGLTSNEVAHVSQESAFNNC